MVIAAWVVAAALSGLFGLASGNPFAPTTVVAPGTETARWYDMTAESDFGANINILLTGPRQEVRRQGVALAARLRAERVRVVSPFDDTPDASSKRRKALRLLRPDSALFIANVPFDPDQEPQAVLEPIRDAIGASVRQPVVSRITGVPTVAEGILDATDSARHRAELLTIPLLIVVLLLIFRSPVAAAVPLILGIGTTVAAGGLVKLIATQATIDQAAVTMASMMALALGVDYSLLLVSRYREHRRADPESVNANIAQASRAAGRTIAFAATLLICVMSAGGLLAVGSILASAALGIAIATIIGALSAIVVAPALLKELDPHLDRWRLPRRRREGKSRLARPQPILIPLLGLLGLLALAAPTMGLDTGAPDAKLLPEGTPARVDYETIGKTVGPGYGAVFNVLIQSRDGRPLTNERSLRAITRLQRELTADRGIATVLGPAELNRVNDAVPALERGLTGQGRDLARLDRGLTQAADGSRSAGDGAGALHSATGEIEGGSSELAQGIDAAARGSAKLATGVGEASDGSAQIVRGSDRVSAGSSKLSDGIEEARTSSGNISNNAEILKNDLRTGDDELKALHAPLDATETGLASSWRALQAMTTGRDDPQFQAAVAAVRAASQALTGADPDNGEQLDPGYEGVAAGLAEAEGQVDLGIYLANRLDKQGDRTQRGVAKLADAARRLDTGIDRLASSNARLSDGLARLASNGVRLPDGLNRLSGGADRLTGGLADVEAGAARLAAGIGGSQTPGQLTGGLDRMQGKIAEQRRGSQSGELEESSPGLFDTGVLSLAIVEGARRPVLDRSRFVIDLAHSGRTAQIAAFPAFETSDPRIGGLRERIAAAAERLDRPNLDVVVGGPGAMLADYKEAATARLPAMVVAFILISLLILVVAVRAVPLAAICVALNILTVGVTFGVMQLAFGSQDPLLGGPGYVDITGLTLTLTVVFALSIDYQVFLLARIREEYVKSGSNDRALTAAIGSTAGVITGAAAVMVAIFLAFCVSSYVGVRQIGVGLAIAVFLDATVVRLVLLPAAMRMVGDDVWWLPGWLDRLLPRVSL